MDGIGNFAELLKSFFPEKGEEQLNNVITVATAAPHRFSHPYAMSQLLQQKWKISAASAYTFAMDLAQQLAKDAKLSHNSSNLGSGGGSGDFSSPYSIISRYMDAMLARSLFQESTQIGGDDGKSKDSVASMDMDQMMKFWLMTKMMGGESNTSMQSAQYILSEVKNSFKEQFDGINGKLKKLEDDADKEKGSGSIRNIILPDENGQPKKYPVQTESDVLSYLTLLMSKGGDDNDDKYVSLVNSLIGKLIENKPQNEDINKVEKFYDKVIEQENLRIGDLKDIQKSQGDIASLIDGVNKLKNVGLRVGEESIDDRTKILESEMKLLDKKFDIWMKADEKRSRDEMWNTLIGKVGEGIENVTKNYSGDIKNFAQQIPSYFKGDNKQKATAQK